MSEHLSNGQEVFLRVGDQIYLSEVLGTSNNNIWVSFPDTDPPDAGDGVTVEVHGDQGFVRYHTHVSATAEEAKGLTLERSQTSGLLKHRQSFRVPVGREIAVESTDAEGIQTAQLIDLSEQGARVESSVKWDVGTMHTLHISLGDRPAQMYPARIVYSNPPEELGGDPIYGFKLGDVPAEAKRVMTSYLAKEIAERYPEELRAMYPRSSKRRR